MTTQKALTPRTAAWWRLWWFDVAFGAGCGALAAGVVVAVATHWGS